MRIGSGTLNRHVTPSAATAISAVGTSITARRASTKQAPPIAPEAAAVTPLTKAFTCGLPPMRSNQGNGITTKR